MPASAPWKLCASIPTNNARRKRLVVLVQALAELGEPQSDQIDTLIREIVKGLTASTNEHGRKEGNLRMKELLEKRISHARETATNSARRISMVSFIQIVGDLLAEIKKHHNQSAAYGLVPRSTASSNKDSDKSKQGGSKGEARQEAVKKPSLQPARVVAAPITLSTSASSKSIPTSTSPGRGRSPQPLQGWRQSTQTTSPDIDSAELLESTALFWRSLSSCPRKLISVRARKVRKYHMMMMMMMIHLAHT